MTPPRLNAMQLDEIRALHAGVSRSLGDWWKDDRRNWCAYCGIPMRKRAGKGTPLPPNKATRDHVIPKAHKGGLVTVPACLACNAAKGTMSLPEFLSSAHFMQRRALKHRNKWPIPDLWALSGLAALKRAEVALAANAPPRPRRATAGHTR